MTTTPPSLMQPQILDPQRRSDTWNPSLETPFLPRWITQKIETPFIQRNTYWALNMHQAQYWEPGRSRWVFSPYLLGSRIITQCFSITSIPKRYVTMSEDIFGYCNWGRKGYCHQVARGQGFFQASHSAQDGPTAKNYPAQTIKVEKRCCHRRHRFLNKWLWKRWN